MGEADRGVGAGLRGTGVCRGREMVPVSTMPIQAEPLEGEVGIFARQDRESREGEFWAEQSKGQGRGAWSGAVRVEGLGPRALMRL